MAMARNTGPSSEAGMNAGAEALITAVRALTEAFAGLAIGLQRIEKRLDAMGDSDGANLQPVVDKLGDIETAIGRVKVGGAGVSSKSPRYKRKLRRGEGIEDLAIKGTVDPVVTKAHDAFVDDYQMKLVKEFGSSDKEVLERKIEAIPSGSAAFRAITAAFLDRTGLDETTRLLLSTEPVLEAEFLRIEKEGMPQLWETLAVMEAINRNLDDRAKDYFGFLVAEHAQKRGGTSETVQKKMVTTLHNQFTGEA
jgi:hypothetical protein